ALVKTDTPAILVVPDDELTHARTMTAGLPGVGVLRASASDDAFTHSVSSLGVASPMDDSDRRFYTAEAVAALRDLAMARPAGLDVNEAKAQLERTVESTSGPAQLQVAEVLALINDGAAQQSLIDAAFASTDEWQQVSLLDLAAASVRRFGDRVSSRQVADLRKFITAARGDTADAAARLYGAMNRGAGVPTAAASGS
ncbi:MAG: hypothetical protein P8M32_01530, partial [Phycisphaerales bacterium]|nr:hypothetical protein [Phycisphaerales bacterium]